MGNRKNDILQGTLALLVLKTLAANKRMHGYAITTHIQKVSGDLLRDLRHSPRALLKTPAFTITVALTLALGIGANSAVFSAIHAVLLRPLPFPSGDQLMQLQQTDRKNPPTPVGPVRLMDWGRLN